MAKSNARVNAKSAEDRLMKYLTIEGVSGEEKNIAAAIVADLKKLGVSMKAIKYDTAHKRIPLPTQTGNLFVTLAGAGDLARKPRMAFATHMDTVPLCAGAKPKRVGKKIVPVGKTALGGDNRTGCAVLVTLAETLLKNKLPHPPITLIFTVREESGLQGARFMDTKHIKGATMCFNVDSRMPADLVTGAVGAQRWDVEIHGKASHAGVAPEKGISSMMVASVALAEARRGGWFGKVVKGSKRGTSNPGIFAGRNNKAAGDATNVITDYVYVRGETRSPDAKFAAKITAAYRAAFSKALGEVKDDRGGKAGMIFQGRDEYPPFNVPSSSPAVKHAIKAAKSMGLKPKTLFSNGGLDANWFAKYGLPTVTIGAGQHDIHTIKEWVNLPEYVEGCQLAVALATTG